MSLICHVNSHVAYLKGYINLCVEAPHNELPPCHVWCLLVQDLKGCKWELLTVCYHPAKFSRHWYCDSDKTKWLSASPSTSFLLGQYTKDIFCKTTSLKGNVTLWIGALQSKSPTCQVWWLQVLWQWRYNDFSGWRARFHMPSLKSAITVYLYSRWLESTQHIMLISLKSRHTRKIHKQLLLVCPKTVTRRRKRIRSR